jgi:hypothetical protein
MAEHLHWSLIFWVNVPLGLGAALLTNIYLGTFRVTTAATSSTCSAPG